MCKKPYINNRQQKARYNWCRAYNSWDLVKWKTVIFSDEYRIELFSTTRSYVRRPINKRYISRYKKNSKIWQKVTVDMGCY